MSTIPEQNGNPRQAERGEAAGWAQQHPARFIDVGDASRLLEVAAHDIAVASTCIGLDDLDEAHTNVLTARVAADAAEEILRTLLDGGPGAPR
jgi:hypothetical protein